MSNWTAEIRRREAEARRSERETRKRHRELERRIKERAKLSALEQARLDVEAHENALEVLLSVHKEQGAPIEWVEFPRFCGLDCDEQNDSYEQQQQNRSALRSGV